MTSGFHHNQTIVQGLHSIVAFSYADAIERSAATGFSDYDIYKLAIDLNDDTFWIILNVDGYGEATWQNLIGSSGGAVGGDLSGALPNPTVIDLHISGQEHGSVLFYNGTHWVVLNPASDGYVLTTHSIGQNPTWSPVITDLSVANQAKGDLLYFDGSNWVVLNAGLDGYVLTAKGVNANPEWDLPTGVGGIGIAAGTQSVITGNVSFINSNGISFGMSNSNQITASYTVPTVPIQTSLNYSNSNNVSFGIVGSTITASASFPAATAFVFSNSNGLSFGTNGSTVTGSYSIPTATSLSFSNGNNVTFGIAGSTLTASVPSQTSLSHSNANGVSFGIAGSTITASVAAQTSPIFSNSNGISFGTNAGTVTASYTVPSVPSQTNQTVGLYALGNTTQNSSTTLDARTLSFNGLGAASVGYLNGSIQVSVPTQTQYSFSNLNGVTFGTAGSTVTASVAVQSIQTQSNIQGISAGTTSQNSGNIVFGNSNGISFGLSAGTITATVNPGAAAGIAANQAGTQTATSGTVVFVNSNGISFGMSGSSQITASYTVPTQTVQSINFSAGTTSNNATNIVFSNSNGLSFGLNGSTITGSYTVPTATSLNYSNSNNVSFGLNGSTLTASAFFNQTAQTQNVVVPSAGTQTATSGTVSFANSNGISFGMSGSNQITASYTVPSTAGLISNVNVSAGTTSNNLSAFVFSNSNNVSFGLNGSTITATVTTPVQTNQTVGGYAVGNTTGQSSSSTFDARSLSFDGAGVVSVGYSGGSVVISAPAQTSLSFSNLNGLTFGIAGSTLTGSYTVPIQSNQTVGLYALGNTTQNSSTTLDVRSLSFNGLGAATVGYSNGSIQVSVPTQTAQTQSNIQAVYDGVNSISTGTIRYSNSNGVSFGINGQTLTASVAVQTNQSVGLYAVSNTTGASSSTTVDARSLSFQGAGVASVGYTNGSVVISVPSGIANVNISAGTTSNNLTNFVFSNSNNVSFGLNGSTVTATVTTPIQTNQSVGLYALGNTTQNSSTTLDARSLSFNGLGAATVGYSNGSIQISVPTQTVQTQNNIQAIYDGANSITTGTIRFTNANGVSFSINGQTISGSVAAQSVQTAGFYAVGNTVGQSSSSTFDARTLSFSGAGIASVGYSAGNIIVNVPAAGASINISAGTTSSNLGALIFGNSNGVSFGLNAGTITATVNPGPAAGIAAIQGGTQTATSGTVIFSNSNGFTFGLSNSSVMTASYTVPNTAGLISFINVSGGTTSNNLSAITFSNSNGLSFGLNGSTITGSYTVPTQTVQTEGRYAIGNTTGQSSSSTFDARTMSISGAGNISVGYSGNALVISATQSAQTQNVVAPSAGTQTATSGTVVFSNSNGISFGMSNSSIITASYTVPSIAGLISNINISAGTTSGNISNFVFSNSNGLAFGLNGSTITGSYTQAVQTSNTFSNSNNVSFTTAGGTIVASASFPAQTNQTIGLYGLGNTTQNSSTTLDARTLSFNGLGAATVGYSNGSIQISVPIQTAFNFSNSNNVSFGVAGSTITATATFAQSAQTQSNVQGISAGTQLGQTGNVIFSNSNGISFGMSNSSIVTASYTVPSTAGLISAINVSAGTTSNNLSAFTLSNSNGLSFGLNGSIITGSYTVPTQTAQTIGLYALGNTTQNSSTTLDARTLSFNGLGGATVGYSNGSIQVSAVTTAGLISGINVSGGTTSNNLTNIVFSNSNNISFGLNGSTITASASRIRVSQLHWPESPWQTNFPISNASFSLQHFNAKLDVVATQANLLMVLSGNTNSSGALTISLGMYTMNGSTMSLASSDSRQITWTSGALTTASSKYGGISGTRYRTVALNSWSITAGDYVLGMWFRTTNNGNWNAFGIQGPTIVGAVDVNETNNYGNGYSTSSFSTAMVASVNVTDTNYVRTGGNAFQQPGVIFLGTF